MYDREFWFRASKYVTVIICKLKWWLNGKVTNNMSYIYLSGAILCEVIGTMVLPLSENFSKPIPSLISIVAYVLAFYLLTFALESIPIAVVYATWSGLGIFLISFLGFTIYGQTLQWQSILGLLFIVAGVVLVNSFASVK